MDVRKVVLDAVAAFLEYSIKTGPKPEFDIPGGTQTDADLALLGLADAVVFQKGGRAQRYLNNFLQGAPSDPMFFSCAEMLTDNPAVRQLVIKEVGASMRMGINSDQRGKYVVVVQQKYFLQGGPRGHDWWGAIGSFRFNWSVGANSNRNRTVIRLWGEDTYRWYPNDPRWTQAVHQAATRLQASYGARAFKVIGTPALMVLNTGEVLNP